MTKEEAANELKCYHYKDGTVPEEIILAIKLLEERPIIKCKDCKYQEKEWREDRRMKEKGYWSYGCKYFGELMGYWGFGGNDNEFCSEAEQRDKQEAG